MTTERGGFELDNGTSPNYTNANTHTMTLREEFVGWLEYAKVKEPHIMADFFISKVREKLLKHSARIPKAVLADLLQDIGE